MNGVVGRGQRTLAVFVLIVFGYPACAPFFRALLDSEAWSAVVLEFPRLGRLWGTTLVLAVGAAALCVPLAAGAAVALFRFRTPGRRTILLLFAAAGCLPLAFFAAGWESIVGPWGFVRVASPGLPTLGDWPAVVILHAVAALPWSVGVIGWALCQVEPEVEESALLDASPAAVLRIVTLPAIRPALAAAALLAAVSVAVEMTVTDLFNVRSLAEEIYFAVNHKFGGERTAVLAQWPAALALVAAVVMGAGRAGVFAAAPLHESVRFRWSPSAWPWMLLGGAAVAVVLAPFVGLVWQLGLVGAEPASAYWSGSAAWTSLDSAVRQLLRPLVGDLMRALLVSAATTAAALILAWQWRNAGRVGSAVGIALAAWMFVTPGPVVGLGIVDLLQSERFPMFAGLADSPLPMMWGQATRALPFAFVVIAQALVQLDRELFDAALVAGAGPWRILSEIVIPRIEPALAAAAVIAGAYAFVELPTAKMLCPAGGEPTVVRLFGLLHQGTANQQAAAALVLAATSTALIAGAWTLAIGRRQRD